MSADVLGPEWNLTDEGLNLITNEGQIKDRLQIVRNALNSDFKDIGKSVLTTELDKKTISKVVLQIQKIRNISAPKANEESQAAPRMLKLVLTDGVTCVQAIELSIINQISLDRTAPGAKVLIQGAKIYSGYILLNSSCCSLLGGKVTHLFEKWELARSIKHNSRPSAGPDGPPQWVNFGSKIQVGEKDGNFKSLETKIKDGSAFEQQRQATIAEATTGATQKVFGGRVKQQVQPNVNTNRRFNNEHKSKNLKGKHVEPKELDVPQKPLEKVSLFDYLETKLPTSEITSKPMENALAQAENTFGNNKLGYKQNYMTEGHKTPRYNTKRDQQYQPYQDHTKPYGKANNSPKNFNRVNNQKVDNNFFSQNSQSNRSTNYVRDHNNSKQISHNVNDVTTSFNQMSLASNSFASKMLRQQLNIDASGQQNTNKRNNTKTDEKLEASMEVGTKCLAKYWEDGKFYDAIITAVTEKTYVVKFKGYGNTEEILKKDCQPQESRSNKRYDNHQYSGNSMEFRGKKVTNRN